MTESREAPAVLPAQTCWLIELAVTAPVAAILLVLATVGHNRVSYGGGLGGVAIFCAIMLWFDWRDHAPSRLADRARPLPAGVRTGSPARFAVAEAVWVTFVVALALIAFVVCDRLIGEPTPALGAVGVVMGLAATSVALRLARIQRTGSPALYAVEILRRRRYYVAGPTPSR